MAHIQTPIRLIKVKETYEEVCNAMESQWLELTEDTYFYGELPGEYHEALPGALSPLSTPCPKVSIKGERKIRLNRDYIIEVQP